MVTGGESRVSLGYATKYWTLAQACSQETDAKFIELESRYGTKVPLLKSYVLDSTKFREMQSEGQRHVLDGIAQMHDKFLEDVAAQKAKKLLKPCNGQGILHVPSMCPSFPFFYLTGDLKHLLPWVPRGLVEKNTIY